jgi:hypothetical protein
MIPTGLRPALAALILILIGGAAAMGVALHIHDSAAAARQQAERDLADARAALERLPQRIALVRAMDGQHAELRRRGFVGNERRLDWVSALAQTQRVFALQGVGWRLEPSRPTSLPGLSVTRMHLSLTPMEPAGLGAWLAHMDGLGLGLFTVEQCEWVLAGPPQGMQCVLDWWALNPDYPLDRPEPSVTSIHMPTMCRPHAASWPTRASLAPDRSACAQLLGEVFNLACDRRAQPASIMGIKPSRVPMDNLG